MNPIWDTAAKFTRFKNKNYVEALVVEVSDFTEPDRATALLWAKLPRDEFRDRPEVWRWNGVEGSIDDRNAYVLLETGRDIVTPRPILRGRELDPRILFELASEDALFEVRDGKPVKDFRAIDDYLDLRTFKSSFTGESARQRYDWISKVATLGRTAAALQERKPRSFIARYWGILFLICALIISLSIWFWL